jgi:hypothetical protein
MAGFPGAGGDWRGAPVTIHYAKQALASADLPTAGSCLFLGPFCS